MTERQLQFRVGMFVIVSFAMAGVLVFQFGKLKSLWEKRYHVSIHFDSAPGVYPSTPVRRSGITIGAVRDITFDERRGGVVVLVEIREEFRLRADAEPRLARSLLGDATIDFTPGSSPELLVPGARLKGEGAVDPMQIVHRLEEQMAVSVESFQATSRQWEQVGRNLNSLMETNGGHLNTVVERAAESLHEFTLTMRNANETFAEAGRLLGDPQNQENLRKTLAELPEMVSDTRDAITTVKRAVEKADENLTHLAGVTEPLASRSTSIVTRLDNSLANLEALSGELTKFSRLLRKEEGSLQKFATDPDLYRNLNRSAASLAVLLNNMEPVVRDLRIFSDKVARHPELIGVSGALRGSSGLKDPPEDDSRQGGGTPLHRQRH